MTALVRAAKLRVEISARNSRTALAGGRSGCRVLEDTDERVRQPTRWLMPSEAEPALPTGQRESPPALLGAFRARKAEVVELLRCGSRRPGITGPRLGCSHRAAWRPAGEPAGWRCSRCEPCEAAARSGATFDRRPPEWARDPDHCRCFGQGTAWPAPVGLVLSDDSAANRGCHEWAEASRVRQRVCSRSRRRPTRPTDDRERNGVANRALVRPELGGEARSPGRTAG